MEKLNNLATLLKETKTMHNKYLAKRVLEQSNKAFNPQDIYLKKDFYKLLLLLVTEDTRDKLVRIDAVIKLISKRIEQSSGWLFSSNNSFINGMNPSLLIERKESGYLAGTSLEEIEFIEKYQEGLEVINSMIEEKEKVLNNPFIVKKEEDRELVEAIIDYLDFKTEVKVKKKN